MPAVREGEGEGLPSSAVDVASGMEPLSSLLLCGDCPKLDFKPSMKLEKPPAGFCESVGSEAPPELPPVAVGAASGVSLTSWGGGVGVLSTSWVRCAPLPTGAAGSANINILTINCAIRTKGTHGL